MDANEFAQLLAPRDPRLLAIARELYDSRADLRAAFPDMASAGFVQWLAVHGVREDARVAAFHPPLPPLELRNTSCGGTGEAEHLLTGVDDFRMLAELHAIYARRSIAEIGAVLDFGCACGRVLRWFQAAVPNARLFGADVRRASIEWCRQNLRGTFLVGQPMPPLALPDASVDVVYALSVFSHLSREQATAWLRELARVVKPGGLLLLSTHGAFALALCSRSREHQALLQIDAERARQLLRALPNEHFVFSELPQWIRTSADGVAADYGQAFFDTEHVRAEWGGIVELVGHVPCALGLFQDMFVLRPRV